MQLAEYPEDMTFATAIGTTATRTARPAQEGDIPLRLMEEAQLCRRLGLSKPLISAMLVRAGKHGTSLETELLASGAVSPQIYYEALAELLGLPFVPTLDPAEVEDLPGADTQLVEPVAVRLRPRGRAPLTAIVV